MTGGILARYWNSWIRAAVAAFLPAAIALAAAGLSLSDALAKMDQAANHFKSLSANVVYLEHTGLINEDDTQSGIILMKRSRSKDLHAKVDIEKPDRKIAVIDGKEVKVYYPSSGDQQKVNLSNRREMMNQILMLGFGGTSKDLESAYTITLGGPDTVGGQATTRLVLVPKSQEMLDQWTKIELWISDEFGYVVQQKLYERGKNFTLITYSNVKLNPDIPDSEFKLDVPKGTKTEPLNKKK